MLELLSKYKKNELTTHFEPKNSPRAYVESELDMLGVPKKLVKYVVHLSKRNN
jgi:hypothetical protein